MRSLARLETFADLRTRCLARTFADRLETFADLRTRGLARLARLETFVEAEPCTPEDLCGRVDAEPGKPGDLCGSADAGPGTPADLGPIE